MWSAPVVTVPSASEPVSLAEAKEFVSLDPEETQFDGLLTGFVAAAREQIEAITGTRLAPQTVRIGASEWGDLAHLPIAPASGVSSIVYADRDGVEQTLPQADYALVGAGTLEPGIVPAHGARWPNAVRSGRDTIRVTLDAGYDAIPRPLWAAMLLMVGDQFAHRESAVVGAIAATVPSSMAVANLLANYRIWA